MKNAVTHQFSTLALTLATILLFSPAISFADSNEASEDDSKKSSVECPEEDVAMMGNMGMGMMGMGGGTQGTQGTMGGMGMGMMGMGMGMMNSEDGETPEDEIKPDGAITHSPCSKDNTDDNTQ